MIIKVCWTDISCKGSINFHPIPQNDIYIYIYTRHHFIHTWQRDSRKTRKTTRLKCWPATQNDDGGLRSAAPTMKNTIHFAKMI